MIYQNIIVGGGAAGLFCAANIKGRNNLLLEGTGKLGQKILITGGGMCNITNIDDTDEFIKRFGGKQKANFLKPAILNLTTENTRKWLEHIGLPTVIREDGKVFPESLKAQSLIDVLQREASRNGVIFKYNCKVKDIQLLDNFFEIATVNEVLKCRNLIIATGGKSFPDTGSDGSSYKIIEKFGHRIIPPSPSLTSVKISNYPFKSLAGTSIKNSFAEFFRNEETKRYFYTNGDLLFTHHGLSGPVILNNSRLIKERDNLLITLISCDNKEQKREELISVFNKSGNKKLRKVLKEIGLTASLTDEFLDFLNIEGDLQAKQLNKKIRNRIINHILNFPFKVTTKTGFKAAMATAGGVDISEINRKTMESKLIPNLYFAGEVMDIDGDTGGYNIQAAFSTAKLAADQLNKLN